MDPNATLAELRSATFNLLHAVDHDLVLTPAEVGRVCELVQAMDEWLSKDGFLPTEWRPAANLDADAAPSAREEWRGGWCSPACSEHHTYAPGCSLSTESARADAFLDIIARLRGWATRLPPLGAGDIAELLSVVHELEEWSEQPVETTTDSQASAIEVHVRVTYRDGTDAYYPVTPDQGWRLDTRTRELVIGKGLGRVHVPLDVVWSYGPEACAPRSDS